MDDVTKQPDDRHIVTMQEVREEIKQRSRNTFPVLPRILDELPPVRIFNIWSEQYLISKGSLGHFVIPACSSGAMFSAPLSVPAIVKEAIPVDTDDLGTRYEYRFHDGRDVANDIIGNNLVHSRNQSLVWWGVFIAAGEQPNEKELAIARRCLLNSCHEMVQQLATFLTCGPTGMQNVQEKHIRCLEYVRSGGRTL